MDQLRADGGVAEAMERPLGPTMALVREAERERIDEPAVGTGRNAAGLQPDTPDRRAASYCLWPDGRVTWIGAVPSVLAQTVLRRVAEDRGGYFQLTAASVRAAAALGWSPRPCCARSSGAGAAESHSLGAARAHQGLARTVPGHPNS